MVVDNNIPPVTVNDSVRIAKGIAAAGFPSAGVVTAAMFLVLPWPWPVIVGVVAIGGVFVAFVAALTKERDEFHKINRVRAVQAAKLARQAALHEMEMKEVGYKASMRVWEAEKLAALGLPTPPAQLPPGETWRIDGTEVPRNMASTVLDRNGKEVRVDILEALIAIGFGPDEVTNIRETLREKFPAMAFRATSLTAALSWLREQEVIGEDGGWLVDEDEARGILNEARSKRPLPQLPK